MRSVHRRAFARPGLVGDDVPEALLVDRLRDSPSWLPHLSLVAVSGDAVIGHVAATRATLEPSNVAVLGVGPLGVDLVWQGRGVGSALMHALLDGAEARDELLVGLLGDPAYYRRFGFVSAVEHGVIPPDPAWGAAFQVRVLSGRAASGAFRYAEPFDHLG